jgi:hypothetical protein
VAGFGDGAKRLLVALERLSQRAVKGFGVARAGDDARVNLGFAPFELDLPEVEHELERVVSDVEVVCISPVESSLVRRHVAKAALFTSRIFGGEPFVA